MERTQNQKRSLGNALSVLISCLLFVRETHASRCFAVGAGRARLHGQCSIRSRRYLRYCDQGCISHTGSCKLSPRCEPTSEERSAGNPHATFHGSRRRVTASGDPVGGVARLPPIPIDGVPARRLPAIQIGTNSTRHSCPV